MKVSTRETERIIRIYRARLEQCFYSAILIDEHQKSLICLQLKRLNVES